MKDSKYPPVYFHNLDALRFLAFFVVFIHHIFTSINFKTASKNSNELIDRYLMNGDLGVSFFFVLSGFLITYLLLKEKESSGKINFPGFYLKRTLRIWPLYFLTLFICFIIIPYFTGYTGSPKIEKNLYVFFLGNFDLVKNGVGSFVSSVLWSISIEEQFYLFWPIFISIVPIKHLTKFLIVLIVLSICYRIFGHSGKSSNLRISYHTFSCFYNLAIGALLAHLSLNKKIIEKLKHIGKYLILFIYTAGIVLIVLQKDILKLEPTGTHYLISILPVFYALFFSFVIAEQAFAKHSLFKIGNIRIFTKLGKISYGLYCYHMIVLFIVFTILTKFKFNTAHPGGLLFLFEAVAAFGLTILISLLSFNFFEKKFLHYKVKILNARQADTIKSR